MRERLAAAAGFVLVAVVVVAILADARPRLAATNTRALVNKVPVTVPAGQEHCQDGQFVPKDATRLRLYASMAGGGRGEAVVVSLRAPGAGSLAQHAVPGGWQPGPLDIGLPPRGRDVDPAVLCVRNTGRRELVLAGTSLKPGEDLGNAIRTDFFRAGRESWLELAPEMARRFTLFKPGLVGPWAMWAAPVVVVVLGAAAAFLVLREPSRR